MTALTLAELKPKRSPVFWLGACICLAAAVISAALDAFAVQRFLPHGTAQLFGISASLVLDAWKLLAPMLVLLLWQARMRIAAVVCGLTGFIPFMISFAMVATFSVVTRADGAMQRAATSETRQDLRTELWQQESQLKLLGVQRPAAVVQAELQSQVVPAAMWRETSDCHITNSTYWQRACRDVVRLRTELAAALAYDKAVGHVEQLRRDLARAEIVSTGMPMAQVVSTITGFDGETGSTWLSLMFAAAIEIVAGLGMAFVQLADRAQSLIRQRDLIGRLNQPQASAQISAISGRKNSETGPKLAPVADSLTAPQLGSSRQDGVTLGNPVRCRPAPDRSRNTTGLVERRCHAEPRNPVVPISATRSVKDTCVAAFFAQLKTDPNLGVQARQLHREFIRRAPAHGWPILTETGFGRRMTTLVKQAGFPKRKLGKVAVYTGVGLGL
jgi:hypothetical protein